MVKKVPGNLRYNGFYDLLSDSAFHMHQAELETDSYKENKSARAAILSCIFSVESCANSLIDSLSLSKALLNEYDKLSAVGKIETYLQYKAKSLDRGRVEVQKIIELIKARNDFVHPKSKNLKVELGQLQDKNNTGMVELPMVFTGELWPQTKLPKKSILWTFKHALDSFKAVANFFNYILIETAGLESDAASNLLMSRLEVGDICIPNCFDVVIDELEKSLRKGVDLSFIGVTKLD